VYLAGIAKGEVGVEVLLANHQLQAALHLHDALHLAGDVDEGGSGVLQLIQLLPGKQNTSHHIISYHITSHQTPHITSAHISSDSTHHIGLHTSHYIRLHTSHQTPHTTPHHIISYHITSHYIRLHTSLQTPHITCHQTPHITSHHIISHHIKLHTSNNALHNSTQHRQPLTGIFPLFSLTVCPSL
jgi:hypothetical protein